MTKMRRRGLVVVLALGAMSVATARDARACPMSPGSYEEMSTPTAERLLLSAKEAANAGHGAKARALAVQVATANGPTESVRARAWALAGAAEWQQGRRVIALRSFRRAQKLDDGQGAIDAVLADVTRLPALAQLKKALAA
jgi:predicted component of type VI protein secretion system